MAEPRPKTDLFSNKEEQEYKEQAKSAIGQVFGYYLEGEIQEKKLKGAKREKYIQNRLPAYFDALKRGHLVLQKRLENGVVFESQSARKIYSVKEDGLQWDITPKSEDPFEIIAFYKNHENGEVSGRTDFWTEHILIELALLEGFKEQDNFFLDFSRAASRINQVKNEAQYILQFLNPREMEAVYFADIASAEKKIKSIQALTDLDPKESFVMAFVVNDNPILQKTSKIADLCDQILALDRFFSLRNGRSISEEERTKQLNSLALELIFNPESFQTASDFLEHPTTEENIAKIIPLLRKNVAALGPLAKEVSKKLDGRQAQRYLLARPVRVILKRNLGHRLNKIFAEIGIDENLGQKFIFNLVSTELESLPGRKEPNLYYYLKREPSPKRNTEKTIKSWDEQKIDIINDFFDRNYYLPRLKFRKIGQEMQRDLLRGIIEKSQKTDGVSHKGTIGGILTGADLVYQTTKEGKSLLEARLAEKSISAQIAVRTTLEVLLTEIKNGNEDAVETLDGLLTQGTVQKSAGKYTLIEREKSAHGFSTKVGRLMSEYRDQATQETEDKLVDFVCLIALDRSFIRGQPGLANLVLELKGMVMSHVSSFIKSTKIGIQMEEMTSEQLARVIYLQTELAERDFLQRANEIREEKRALYLNLGQNLTEAIIRVLENSLS